MPNKKSPQTGATLIELIITIVIISIALTGILSIVNLTSSHSADPMVQQQSIAIAESYLEEILLLPVIDPDGSNTGETRATFDNVDDYNGLADTGAQNQAGSAISGLGIYNISVTINDEVVSAINMKTITVQVDRAGIGSISLAAYRADY
ncbi:MAG TPA: prepilin-type N-terminal cleavage/methylation domain-containing protein [Methylophaga sp.]|nr:prepilin-type N-terminal cleavage/methylation domain-containing protein [Methylophaga sp.]